jgi:uncharacterized membrane protein YdbT with pleckstrin-like domain
MSNELHKFELSKLDEGEEVVFEVRKHWLIMVLTSLSLVGFLVAAVLAVYVINVDFIKNSLNVDIDKLEIALLSGFILLASVVFFISWTDYYLDVWVITNRRLIDIEQKGLFHRDIATLKLEKIQDVTVAYEGIIPTLFGFGELRVQTAGTATEFKMTHVPNPKMVANVIITSRRL